MSNCNNQLKQLSLMTEIVADTGEIDHIQKLKPVDATTNPSLLFKAAKLKEYKPLMDDAINYAKKHGGTEKQKLENAIDKLSVNFGVEILKTIPGFVSTEIDARLSFDTEATVLKARKLMKLYEDEKVDSKKRVLIKIASTWEGLQAMKILQKEGIKCNMTLVFNIWQAATAAEYGAFLISPFVGRITDWHKAKHNWNELPSIDNDPGVQSVYSIYSYYKTFGYRTIVMGASFRSKEQVLALSGADKLTISPKLLEELKASKENIKRILSPDNAKYNGKQLDINEKNYRWGLNMDAVSIEKLSDGIRNFTKDTEKLEEIIRTKF
jgi:transaldolase